MHLNNLKNKVASILQTVLLKLYKMVRTILPSYGKVKLSGYTTCRQQKILDEYVPGYPNNRHRKTYEYGILKSIEKYVKDEMSVVVIGGGKGITTIAAAKKVGKRGHVTSYEGNASIAKELEKNVEINEVSKRTQIVNKAVSKAGSVYGQKDSIEVVKASHVPICDVLILDAEGSEIFIINHLDHIPEVLIVETHGMYGAGSDKVTSLMQNLSYDIASKQVADKDKSKFCRKNDIFVVVGLNRKS